MKPHPPAYRALRTHVLLSRPGFPHSVILCVHLAWVFDSDVSPLLANEAHVLLLESVDLFLSKASNLVHSCVFSSVAPCEYFPIHCRPPPLPPKSRYHGDATHYEEPHMVWVDGSRPINHFASPIVVIKG
jgi:hypothetical protein